MVGFVVRVALAGFRGQGARATRSAIWLDFGRSGPTRSQDAGRGAGAFDALLGWKLLCGEVPEQSAAFAGADE